MSHFTTINIEIRDIQALQNACGELGLSIEQNAEARGYGSQRQHGDFVIRLNGPYDVALQHQADGSYAVHTDLWQGHVERELGQNFGRLKQLYGVHKATLEARRHGLAVRRQTLNNGSIRLALCRV